MNRRSSTGQIIAAILGLLTAVALTILLMGSNSTEIEVFPSVTLGNPQEVAPDAAVVYGKHHSGGTSILGLRFGHTSYLISVQFYAAPGCYELTSSGDTWPTPYENCRSNVPIAGEISGGGSTSTGESIISVDVDVSKDCYQAVIRNESWPPVAPACAPR